VIEVINKIQYNLRLLGNCAKVHYNNQTSTTNRGFFVPVEK